MMVMVVIILKKMWIFQTKEKMHSNNDTQQTITQTDRQTNRQTHTHTVTATHTGRTKKINMHVNRIS